MDHCFACDSQKVVKQWIKDLLELGDEVVLFVVIPVIICDECHVAIVNEEGMAIRTEAMAWYYRQRGVPEDVLERALLLPQNTRADEALRRYFLG